ncbi:hypothetical protein [Streptomyces sp. YGL11-2]|uniref:hypothetical protein n=1 Tax=Streptomyces sp. YGL11-2 TaxID=3414028 RepID=UPI003CF592DB
MTIRNSMTVLVVSAVTVGAGVVAAGPAEAGSIIGALSPAFHHACANEHTVPRATGRTAHGTGTLGGSRAATHVVNARKRCGGADIPLTEKRRLVARGKHVNPCLLVTAVQCTTREMGSLSGDLFLTS